MCWVQLNVYETLQLVRKIKDFSVFIQFVINVEFADNVRFEIDVP